MVKADLLVLRVGIMKASLKTNRLKAKESCIIGRLATPMMVLGQEIVLTVMVVNNGRKPT